MKHAIIGFPIELMARVLNIGGPAGYALTAAVVLPRIVSIASTINSSIMNEDVNLSANKLGTLLGRGIEALITFMDLNAQDIEIDETRRLSRIDVPGRDSDYIQDLGHKSATYKIRGNFYAMDPKKDRMQSPFAPIFKTIFDNVAVGNTQLLRMLMRTGIPAPFMCRYEISEVIIRKFHIHESGGNPELVRYTLDLIEYRRLPSFAKMAGLAIRGALG